MATVNQGSILFAGDVSKQALYIIKQGEGLTWANHVRTEINIGGKPRQLTKAGGGENPIRANVATPRQADFDAGSAITIDGRQLSVSPLMVPQEIDLTEWKETFPEYQPTGNNNDLQAAPQIRAAVTELMMENAKTQLNLLHSAGNSALAAPSPLRHYDGFETLVLADADATEAATGAEITPANVLTRFFALRDSTPPRLRNSGSLKFFCSYKAYDIYDYQRRTTQTQQAITDLEGSQILTQSINGARINIVPVEGLSNDFVLATKADTTSKSNLVQGFWFQNDLETLKIYRSEEGDQTIKMLLRFDAGVQYVTGKDIWYIKGL